MFSNERAVALHLIGLPIFVYLISYGYLAYYHQDLWLGNTIVHEGGIYTFVETLLYASHFLGHVPVHCALSLWLIGCYLCMTPQQSPLSAPLHPLATGIGVIVFLGASAALSVWLFGTEDTMIYILQQRQSLVTAGEGGSWNLHLPSTCLMLAMTPLLVWPAKLLSGKALSLSGSGLKFLVAALVVVIGMTFAVNSDPLDAAKIAWTHPRYLAHSVRELATFPATYYPWVLIILLWTDRSTASSQAPPKMAWMLIICAIIFLIGFSYQVLVPLTIGIDILAQKPAFTAGKGLGIPYLLASHYFEHFLDTLFFLLFSLFLISFSAKYGPVVRHIPRETGRRESCMLEMRRSGSRPNGQ